jgi:low affinity Fe/Cu permease
MTWRMFIEVTVVVLLATIVIQNTNFLNADWCAPEIVILREQVSEIHTEIVP